MTDTEESLSVEHWIRTRTSAFSTLSEAQVPSVGGWGQTAVISVCAVAIESHMVLVGGKTAIDRPGVGRRNLEADC